MKIAFRILIVVLALILRTGDAFGGSQSFLVGPTGSGNGGSNPVSIPPINPIEWKYNYLSDSGFETNVSISPGILFGGRMGKGSTYVSVGGGFLFDANGYGPGAYASFGYVTGGNKSGWHFNFEYMQTIGYDADGDGGIISPSAARVGIIWN